MIRRKTNRKHMTGDHHGRTAKRATLLVTATDEILGTHRTQTFFPIASSCRTAENESAKPRQDNHDYVERPTALITAEQANPGQASAGST